MQLALIVWILKAFQNAKFWEKMSWIIKGIFSESFQAVFEPFWLSSLGFKRLFIPALHF